MESLEAYLDRKYQELELLNGFLGSPLTLRHPVNPDEVISQKFHIAAAMKAEHTLHDCALLRRRFPVQRPSCISPTACTLRLPPIGWSTNNARERRLRKWPTT